MQDGPSIVRKLGGGFDRPGADKELPIDINYQRLVDWLVVRGKLPKDWHKRVETIKAKAQDSLASLPPGLLPSLPGGADASLDYQRALLIRDKLLPGAEKTLFGGLSGAAGVWDKIVRAYEKDAVYLGEAAQQLAQHVDFEAPYLRKQSAKLNQTLIDHEKKEAELIKAASVCAAGFQQECQKQGIAGVAVRSELRQLTEQLPTMFLAVVTKLQSSLLGAASDHYAAFTAYTSSAAPTAASARTGKGSGHSIQNSAAPAAPRAGDSIVAQGTSADVTAASDNTTDAAAGLCQQPMLPTLADVRAGLTSAPLIHMHASMPALDDSAIILDTPTSWTSDVGAGVAQGQSAAGGGIDWDLGATTTEDTRLGGGAPIEVAWDFGGDDGNDAVTALADDGGGIDWDIGVTDVGSGSTDPTSASGGMGVSGTYDRLHCNDSAVGTATAAPGGRDPDMTAALRLEKDVEYRALLLDDLQELHAFLSARRMELTSGGRELLASTLPESIAGVGLTSIEAWRLEVQEAIAAMTGSRLRELLLIGSSKQYLDRLTATLQRKAGQEARMLASARELAAKRQEAKEELVALQPAISTMVERVRGLKSLCEKGVSVLHGGRTVNVMGEVNNVLAAAGQAA